MVLRSSPLIRPPGPPGINPLHVASQGIVRLSAIPIGGGTMMNIAPSRVGSIIATPSGSTQEVDGSFGLAVGSVYPNGLTLPGQYAADDANCTIAMFYRMTVAESNTIFSNSSDTNLGVSLIVADTNGFFFANDGVGIQFSSALALNVPYFIAFSRKAGVGIDCVIARLDNGTIVSETASSAATSSAPDGTYILGGTNFAAKLGGISGPQYFSNIYLSAEKLRQWATDPWAFWYPRRFDPMENRVGASVTDVLLAQAWM